MILYYSQTYASKNVKRPLFQYLMELHYQCRMLVVHTVCQFCAFSVQPGKHRGNIRSLPFIVSLHIPVFLLGDFTVFPVLIKRLLVACYLCQFPLFCSYQIVQSVRLAFLIGAELICVTISE